MKNRKTSISNFTAFKGGKEKKKKYMLRMFLKFC